MKELLQKFILNKCTEAEIEDVVAYFQKATSSNEFPSVEDVTQLLQDIPEIEEDTKNRIYQKVLVSAKKREHRKRKLFFWQYAAAIFVGFLCIGYYYKQDIFNNKNEELYLQEDFITLELEDGKTKIISQDGNVQVLDKTGNVIVKQDGNRLVYDNDSKTSNKLVYNTLKVPYGKRFQLQLSDGTKVHLNAGTSLKYPVTFLQGQKRQVFLTGEAYFDVSKDTEHPFIINADNLNIKVLGTQFNVSNYPEDVESQVVLVEGSVDLYSKEEIPGKTYTHTLLKPGFKGNFNKQKLNISTERVETSLYTSWRIGDLVFRNMPFNNILKKLERHYDVSIINNNHELALEKFNASFTEVPIEKILEYLKITYAIDFTINEKNIIIK